MAIAERLFLPSPKENAESDKKVGVRVSRRILKQQQERIAAEKLEGKCVVVSRMIANQLFSCFLWMFVL
jgi:hypothetical protein